MNEYIEYLKYIIKFCSEACCPEADHSSYTILFKCVYNLSGDLSTIYKRELWHVNPYSYDLHMQLRGYLASTNSHNLRHTNTICILHKYIIS